MTTVSIVGWREGVMTVSLIEAVRVHTSKSLLESKRLVERVLEGEVVGFEFESPEEAAAFSARVEALGAVVQP